MTKDLILLTNGFPYEKGEQFLETEIEYLAKHFRKIYIYPISWNGEERKVPQNVEIIKFNKGLKFSVKKLFFKRLKVVLNFLFSEFIAPKRRKYYKGKFKFYFDSFMGILNDANNFHYHLKTSYSSDIQIYSYWFGPWGSIMAIVNDISYDKIKFITRVHGYDYDVNRYEKKFIPFRNYQMKHLKAIYTVSTFAKNRIFSEYSNFKNIEVQRLGVNSFGVNHMNLSNNEICIVSCSNLIPLKRVHLIVEILSKIERPLKWVHFGDGPLMSEIKSKSELMLPNCNVIFKGFVPNIEVLEFYMNNYVDMFINVSEFEGIPVSIMEAISFGIPVVGCEICGVPEIVTEKTGILLDLNFNPENAAKLMNKFFDLNVLEKQIFRNQIIEFWLENFSAEVNYPKFIRNCFKS
jgi:glycosyltransferase involved in cell wall biosynthesis